MKAISPKLLPPSEPQSNLNRITSRQQFVALTSYLPQISMKTRHPRKRYLQRVQKTSMDNADQSYSVCFFVLTYQNPRPNQHNQSISQKQKRCATCRETVSKSEREQEKSVKDEQHRRFDFVNTVPKAPLPYTRKVELEQGVTCKRVIEAESMRTGR